MNFLPSQNQGAEEYNAALIADHIRTLETKEEISEQDLEHLVLIIFQAELPLARTQDLMHQLGLILGERPDSWLREQSDRLLAAAYMRREYTEHSLPDDSTSTMIINTIRSDFENTLFMDGEDPIDEEEFPIIESSFSELEQSGVFSDEEEIPVLEPIANKEKPTPEEPRIIIPKTKDPLLKTLRRLRDKEWLPEDSRIRMGFKKKFLEMIEDETLNFNGLVRGDFFDSIDGLLSQITTFLHVMDNTVKMYTQQNRTYMETFTKTNTELKKTLLEKKRQILELRERYEIVAQVHFKRRRQIETIEEIREELQVAEEAHNKNGTHYEYMTMLREAVIFHVRDMIGEQLQLPQDIKKIQTETTQIAEEIYALEGVFPNL
jgi:hypothetical protein